jgi:hypothetical protein
MAFSPYNGDPIAGAAFLVANAGQAQIPQLGDDNENVSASLIRTPVEPTVDMIAAIQAGALGDKYIVGNGDPPVAGYVPTTRPIAISGGQGIEIETLASKPGGVWTMQSAEVKVQGTARIYSRDPVDITGAPTGVISAFAKHYRLPPPGGNYDVVLDFATPGAGRLVANGTFEATFHAADDPANGNVVAFYKTSVLLANLILTIAPPWKLIHTTWLWDHVRGVVMLGSVTTDGAATITKGEL